MSKPKMFSVDFDKLESLSYTELVALAVTAYSINYEYGLAVANRIREFENEGS